MRNASSERMRGKVHVPPSRGLLRARHMAFRSPSFLFHSIPHGLPCASPSLSVFTRTSLRSARVLCCDDLLSFPVEDLSCFHALAPRSLSSLGPPHFSICPPSPIVTAFPIPSLSLIFSPSPITSYLLLHRTLRLALSSLFTRVPIVSGLVPRFRRACDAYSRFVYKARPRRDLSLSSNITFLPRYFDGFPSASFL